MGRAQRQSLCEAFGFERGISHGRAEAPVFFAIVTGMIVLGAAVVLIPGAPLINILLFSQFIDGLMLPVLLFAIINLCNRKLLLGRYVNGRIFNAVAVGTAAVLTVLSMALLAESVWPKGA